jgi:cytochrome c peroxidase
MSIAAPARKFAALMALVAAAATCTGAAAEEPIKPLPASVQVDPAKADLGKKLFFDVRLSRDNSVSCASCHRFDSGGAFPGRFPVGAGGQMHALNSPSVFNVAFNFRQLWAGGADSVEEVVDQVVRSPQVFASTWEQVLAKLSSDAALLSGFRKVYPAGMTQVNVGNALGEYTRSLVTPNARFDKYLRGDKAAISADELKGYELFKKYGCVSCHQGINVGGNMFQKFGVMGNYLQERGNVRDVDLGRFNLTHHVDDRFVFKVPSLRNVALTAPYFHDGSVAMLSDAVQIMFKYQLGRPATTEDVNLIVKFLSTLNGEPPTVHQ